MEARLRFLLQIYPPLPFTSTAAECEPGRHLPLVFPHVEREAGRIGGEAEPEPRGQRFRATCRVLTTCRASVPG
jgi:hypothetical protein